MGMTSEFRKFAMRGNVADLAVAVVIGAAFGKVVASLVDGLIMPVVGLLIVGVDFGNLAITLKEAVIGPDGEIVAQAVLFRYGAFLQTVVDFTIIAFAIFIVVRMINSMKAKEEAAPSKPSAEVELLTEIRDSLKSRTA